ncbi:mariner Mos1 transposase [Trichonephila clavipes]|nr:mariner Mos1 transposase [Trichonephila clavipes]
MSAYEPNSRHLREVLIFCFNIKRNLRLRLIECSQIPMLLARQRRKGFLHRIATGDEKWVRYDNPKRRKSWGYPGHASTSTVKPNIHGSKDMLSIWWDQVGAVYYELLKPTETITGDRYRTQLMRLSRALKDKRPQYNERYDKVILQHDNARPHVAKVVKTYLETLKWEVLHHPLYSPDLAPSDYPLFRSMAHGLADQHFRSYEEVKNWIDSKTDGVGALYGLVESFFKNDEGHNVTVNGDRYRAIITNFFIPELNNHDVQELWFQQDGATCHTARAIIDLLKDTFGDHLISRFGPVNWPPRSCDLTPLDYFLWGNVKSLVYADKAQALDHLEDNIRRVIANIRPQMLEKVIENWTSRLDYIRASRGSHMPEIIFRIQLEFSRSTVSRVYQEYKDGGQKNSNRANCKGQLALTVRREKRLRRIVGSQRSQTLAQITIQLNDDANHTASNLTVQRSLHRTGFGSHRPTRVPLHNAPHPDARLA